MTTKIFLSTRAQSTILFFFGFALGAKMAEAQPLFYTYVSLEARIAQAESVVHGTISHLSRTLVIPPGAYVTNIDHWDGRVVRHITEKPDGEVHYRVTVKVDEIIKGLRRKTVDVVLQTDAYDKRPEQWTEQQTAFVWFIGDRRQPNSGTSSLPYWNTVRLGAAVPGEHRFSSELALFSMDFTRLDDVSEILARARKFAKRPSGPLKLHTFYTIPGGRFMGELIVPVVPSLEMIAKGLINSSGGSLSHAAGLGAMRYFKSRPNIKIVKSFLDDPFETCMEITSGDRIGSTVRQYPLRSTAYDILKDWGVDVPQPIVEQAVTNRTERFDYYPCSVAVDRAGNVFVGDTYHSIIRKLSPAGTNWVESIIADAPAGASAARHQERRCNLAVDSDGNVFVADGFRAVVWKLTPVGTNWISTTLAGRAGHRGSIDGTNRSARFEYPSGIAVDKTGNIYVADLGNHTIRKLTAAGTNWVVTTIAGDASKRGWGSPTNRAERISYPNGLTVDDAGNIYVTNTGDQDIQKLTRTETNWVMSTIVGHARGGCTDGPSSAALFRAPHGLAMDKAANVYVADSTCSVIRKLTPLGTNWMVSTIAGEQLPPTDQKPVTFADGTGSAARFYYPQGLAVDNQGNVYVADPGNRAVRKLTPVGSNWMVSTIAGGPENTGAAKE